MFTKRKKGFTLSEVLITLGIIGVVAAVTIPTLIVNQQKQELASKFEKTYSVLNQALMKYAADNGCGNDLACTGLFSDTVANNVYKWDDFVGNYLKVAKTCRTSPYSCFTSVSYKYLNSTGNAPGPAGYGVILADGISVGFNSGDGGQFNCGYLGNCGFISIDTNGGNKGPNQLGRDYFAAGPIVVNRFKGIVPYYGANGVWKSSSSNAWRNCETSIDSYGYGCAARMIENGWVMDY